MIKAVLFDKDGTLVEFEETWHSIFKEIFRHLQKKEGLSKEKTEGIKKISGFKEDGFEKESLIQYATVEEILIKWERQICEDKFSKDFLRKIMEDYSKGSKAHIFPLPGAIETLKNLYQKGFILGVATADSKESTKEHLYRLGVENYFHFIGSDDGFYRGKPDPHMGEVFMERHGLKPEEVLYVGDSLTDMAFAKGLGFKFIGVKGKNNSWEDFAAQGYPVIQNIKEIEGLLSVV